MLSNALFDGGQVKRWCEKNQLEVESVHPRTAEMSPFDVERQHETLVENLLRTVHRQSLDGPARSPFWREGPWRCEFYESQSPARLKVFRGEACVHEEVVQNKETAPDRCVELKRVFLESQRGGREDALLG